MPAKQKVTEKEPEPEHKVSEEGSRDIDLFVSAEINFAEYECSVKNIWFKDTYMFQTRAYR